MGTCLDRPVDSQSHFGWTNSQEKSRPRLIVLPSKETETSSSLKTLSHKQKERLDEDKTYLHEYIETFVDFYSKSINSRLEKLESKFDQHKNLDLIVSQLLTVADEASLVSESLALQMYQIINPIKKSSAKAELSKLISYLHVDFDRENEQIILEWNLPEKRLCTILEPNKERSSWYIIYPNLPPETSEYGFFKVDDMKGVFSKFLS